MTTSTITMREFVLHVDATTGLDPVESLLGLTVTATKLVVVGGYCDDEERPVVGVVEQIGASDVLVREGPHDVVWVSDDDIVTVTL